MGFERRVPLLLRSRTFSGRPRARRGLTRAAGSVPGRSQSCGGLALRQCATPCRRCRSWAPTGLRLPAPRASPGCRPSRSEGEPAAHRPDGRDAGTKLHAHTAIAGECRKAVANVLGAIRSGKRACPTLLRSASGMPRSFSKNARCSCRGHDRSMLRRRWGRGIGDEPLRRQHRRQHVASPAAADQILRPPSAVRSIRVTSAPPLAANAAAPDPPAAPITATDDTDYADLRGLIPTSSCLPTGSALPTRCAFRRSSEQAIDRHVGDRTEVECADRPFDHFEIAERSPRPFARAG